MKKNIYDAESLPPAAESGGEKSAELSEASILKRTWLDVMIEARREFPEYMQTIMDKLVARRQLSGRENSDLARFRDAWWQDQFGISFEFRNKPWAVAEKPDNKFTKAEGKIWYRAAEKEKKDKMATLHQHLKSLSENKPIEQFQDESRKRLYYDPTRNLYFVGENGGKKYLGLGDIVADYAWGIKYSPDKNHMDETIYRRVAKRILINETRRDIENIYGRELIGKYIAGATVSPRPPLSYLERNWGAKESQGTEDGFVAEIMAQELLTRISLNRNLPFVVMRSTPIEDSVYKYDFKIMVLQEGNVADRKKTKTVGVQFTIAKEGGKKRAITEEVKKRHGQEFPVDDIVVVRIVSDEFKKAFSTWLEAGKPAGGPEQFLSDDLKIRIVQDTIGGVLNIGEEDIKKYLSIGNSA